MKFGYSTNAFVRFSLLEAVEKIAGLGFQAIEIMCDRPHLYPPDYGQDELACLKKAISELGLIITNLNSFTLFAVGDTYLPSWIESSLERREIRIRHTVDCLKAARTLGCGCISVPPGGPLNEINKKEALSLFRQGLERILPLAETLNVKVLIEPEPDLLIENSSQFKSFIQDLQSDFLGLNFDMGHFFCVGEDPVKAFEDLFPWIGHVHLEDIAATRLHHHLIAGEGVIPFLDLFRTMAALGYRGDVSLELYPYVDRPEEAGRTSLQYLRPIFREAGLNFETSSS
jgi:sugar phosphate isomerase/epimerase